MTMSHKEALEAVVRAVWDELGEVVHEEDAAVVLRAYLDARGLVMVPRCVEYDDALNDMGWRLNSFLTQNGAQFDGRVFNNMKGHLKQSVTEWLSAAPDPFGGE